MVKYIFASHGTLAKGMLSAVELILGKQPNIKTICGYIDDDFEISSEIERIFNSFSKEDEVIIITDILGGSINNEFLRQLGRRKFHLITGLNLPLVLELIVSLNENGEENLEAQINTIIKKSITHIKYCNPIFNNLIDDDNF